METVAGKQSSSDSGLYDYFSEISLWDFSRLNLNDESINKSVYDCNIWTET